MGSPSVSRLLRMNGLAFMKCNEGVRLFLASCVLSLLLRAPHFQHPFTFIDEAWWAVGARELLQGAHLYEDVWLTSNLPSSGCARCCFACSARAWKRSISDPSS